MPNTTGTKADVESTPHDADAVVVATIGADGDQTTSGFCLSSSARLWTAVGTGLAVVVFWLLGTMGHPTELLSTSSITSNFFDAQARSLMAGHFDVPGAAVGVEGFATGHGTQMYFGVFPAILRMPVLALTDAFDGRLALPSQLLAVLVLCIASARLARLAQLQVARQRPTALEISDGWYAAFAAAPLLCSPALFLASKGLVYHEAILWGAAATVWGLDAALRWWFEPTRRRLVIAVVVASVAIGSRPSSGLAPMLSLGMFGVVLACRRQFMAAASAIGAAGVAAVTYSAVNLARFGQLWGAPFRLQATYAFSEVQRRAVAETGGTQMSPRFAVSTLWRYFDPLGGMHPTRLFPFVEWGSLPTIKLGAPMSSELTGSLPSSAPVLLICAVIGAGWLVGRRGRVAWSVPVAATVMASMATLCFWFVSHRYLVDLVPPALVLALPGAWAALDWLGACPRWRRAAVLTLVALLATFATVGQAGLAILTRNLGWFPEAEREQAFIRFRYSVDETLFGGAPPRVRQVSSDPRQVDVGDLVIVGDCDALYYGEYRWFPVERASAGGRRAVIVAKAAGAELGITTVTLVTGDGWQIDARPSGTAGVATLVYLSHYGAAAGGTISAIDGSVVLDAVADPWTNEVIVSQNGRVVLQLANVSAGGLAVSPGWTVFRGGTPFCRSLLARMPQG